MVGGWLDAGRGAFSTTPEPARELAEAGTGTSRTGQARGRGDRVSNSFEAGEMKRISPRAELKLVRLNHWICSLRDFLAASVSVLHFCVCTSGNVSAACGETPRE